MKQRVNKSLNIKVKVALLGAIAFIFMFIDFPILPAAPFLKLDFGDVPALIGTFALGPIAGIAIQAIKVILCALIKGSASAMIGEVANFSIGAVWVLVVGFIYNKNKTRKNAFIGLGIGALVLTLFAVVCNYYVFLPLYSKVVPALNATTINYMLTIIVPFNLIKGVIVSFATAVLYKKLSPFIKGQIILNKKQIV